MSADYGDIIAVQGVGWLSDHIRSLTGNGPVSHVGIVTATEPFIQVAQALDRVRVLSIEEMLDDATIAKMWLLKSPLTVEQRNVACRNALKHVGDSYAYWNIMMQAADSEFGTEWFTEHLAETKREICSEVTMMVEPSIGLIPKDATPNDIWGWWQTEHWPIVVLK